LTAASSPTMSRGICSGDRHSRLSLGLVAWPRLASLYTSSMPTFRTRSFQACAARHDDKSEKRSQGRSCAPQDKHPPRYAYQVRRFSRFKESRRFSNTDSEIMKDYSNFRYGKAPRLCRAFWSYCRSLLSPPRRENLPWVRGNDQAQAGCVP
jgi:hypothetical protein